MREQNFTQTGNDHLAAILEFGIGLENDPKFPCV